MKKTRIVAILLLIVTALTAFPACGECEHTFDGGVCTKCGDTDPDFIPICAHEYKDGTCTKCGVTCAHTYENGVCTVCGKGCAHSYTDGVCTVCGKNCAHSYTDGVCTVCGKNCSHSYTDGVCTVCGKNCAHSYTDGVCTVCGKNCSHSYTDGVCTVCGKGCAHSYTDGVCTVCGMKKPTVIPEDGGASVYAPIISRFKELILYKNTYTELPPKGDSEPEYVDALYEVGAEYSPEKDMGYALRDINGDGLLELVLMERDCHVHALFTIVDGAPVTVKVFQQGMGYLLPNYIGNYKSNDIGYNNHCGTVFYNEKDWDSDGQILMINRIMTLTSDGRLVGIGYGWRDGDGAFSTENDTVYFRINDGVTTDIEKTEYDGIAANYEYFWSYPSRLTRWVGLYFEPALPAQILDIPTADFSTYDGIIKTFGDMFFEVAYNPLKGKSQFDKSKWTGGTYETLMRFKSAEDYYIFNRLVGACVTVQSSSSAKFGYALKDIDGNGSEELILMESKGYILAIFTLKDGKAVLLDTYSDLKSIWVDAGGLLHVQERALPGNKGDTLYTVYALKDGELVPTLSVGYLCKKDGYKNTPYLWFVIEDGKTVQKSQGDWDVNYYAKWLGDIGTGKYYEYNLKNAGITFTELTDDSE